MGKAIGPNDFGKREGGGRRNCDRRSLGLGAVIRTLFGSRSVELIDVSPSGARIGARRLPPVGSDLLLRVEAVEAFATVVWVQGDECGLEFDETLSPEQLALFEQEARLLKRMRLTPQQKFALDHWSASQLC